MGVLVPEDFDVAGLENEAERRVVDACVHNLSDGWLVLPNVVIKAGTRDHELDVVLVHESFGVIDLEVKGHRPELRQGSWFAHGARMEPQPPKQAHDNSYVLRDRIRTIEGLGKMKVPYAVVLPNASDLDGRLGADLKPEQVILGTQLADLAAAVERVAMMWAAQFVLDADDVQAIVGVLRPDAAFVWDPTARLDFARTRLDDLCAAQVRSLETLDRNPRVLVLGAAGTGKTRLAESWARRALLDGQRVLVTCYNEPLSDAVAARLPDDPDLIVGPFLRLALGLEGMAPLTVPDDADYDWWTITAPQHLAAHWGGVTERFDTIVVDEGQDFSPQWLTWLEGLLDPDGRLLVVADASQEIYPRGFIVPGEGDGWAQCELVSNCRNSFQIARLLRSRLGGGAAPSVAPEALGVRFIQVPPGDVRAAAEAVCGELEWLVGDEQRAPSGIAVLSCASAIRDRLLAGAGFVRWEHRGEGVLCENVHRAKGLESDTVVLVADGEVDDALLYVGVSRAVSELVVIGPAVVGERLGLE
ncbi:NERD domain-containing protein [Aquihabitans daechungensis]|uniref:NERD domain-containing protein n=1 Tax=Aquihabitans daechungensis TaxID=1052257 RepID=UPI003BA24587